MVEDKNQEDSCKKNKKIKIDLAFVLLHYQTIEDTIESVSAIQRHVDTANYHIMIVDNCSPNSSGKYLKKIYCNNSYVTVICLNKNLGYAKGNNVGIKFANKKYQFDFLICLNNDVNLLCNNIYEKCISEFHESNFAVLGPMILSRDGRCDSNPANTRLYTKKEILDSICFYRKALICDKLGMYCIFHSYFSMKNKIKKMIKKILGREMIVTDNKDIFLCRCKQVKLHGCFLIFSNNYFEKYSGFDERTFMFYEEDILLVRCLVSNLIIQYSPNILIYHKEDSATDAVMSTKRKRIFESINTIKSLNVLLSVYEETKINSNK